MWLGDHTSAGTAQFEPKPAAYNGRHSLCHVVVRDGRGGSDGERILRHSSITVTTGTDVDVIEEVQRVAVSGMNELSGIQGVDGSRDDRIMRLLSSRTSEALSWNNGKGL